MRLTLSSWSFGNVSVHVKVWPYNLSNNEFVHCCWTWRWVMKQCSQVVVLMWNFRVLEFPCYLLQSVCIPVAACNFLYVKYKFIYLYWSVDENDLVHFHSVSYRWWRTLVANAKQKSVFSLFSNINLLYRDDTFLTCLFSPRWPHIVLDTSLFNALLKYLRKIITFTLGNY